MAFFLPLGLTIIGIIVMIIAYTNMRQGGARVYTLEREAILRRAGLAMFLSTSLFVLAIAWLLYQQQLTAAAILAEEEAATTELAPPVVEVEADGAAMPDATQTPGGTIQIPDLPTITPTPTIDPNLPTATPTPVIVRAFIVNTGGNGLTMRDTPGGELLLVLQEEEFVTVLEDEGTVDVNGLIWVKVRTFLGEEGWVARDFLEIEGQS